MLGIGFKQIQNMAGGITAWIQAGYHVTAPTSTQTSFPTIKPITTLALSSNGLQLRLSLNTTGLAPGEALQINVARAGGRRGNRSCTRRRLYRRGANSGHCNYRYGNYRSYVVVDVVAVVVGVVVDAVEQEAAPEFRLTVASMV